MHASLEPHVVRSEKAVVSHRPHRNFLVERVLVTNLIWFCVVFETISSHGNPVKPETVQMVSVVFTMCSFVSCCFV